MFLSSPYLKARLRLESANWKQIEKGCCLWLGPFEVENKPKYDPIDLSALSSLICHKLLSDSVVIIRPCPLTEAGSSAHLQETFTKVGLPKSCSSRNQFPEMICSVCAYQAWTMPDSSK
jgi:hypothetical protein